MCRDGELTLIGKAVMVIVIGLIAGSGLQAMSRGEVPHPWAFRVTLAGFVAFLILKISVIRSGRLVSFGTGPMSPDMANLHRLGYWLMVVGLLISFVE